jgi:hypothetical protein
MRALYCFLLLACGSTLLASDAEAVWINLRIAQHAATDGGLSYEIVAYPIGGTSTLTAPDGTLTTGPANRISLTGLTHSELISRFTGTWSFTATFPWASVYQFTLADLPALPVPALTGPLDGATVGTSIDVQWAYPGGNGPQGEAISYDFSNPPASATVDFGTIANHALVNVDLAGASSTAMTIAPGGTVPILNLISPVTPQDSSGHLVSGIYATFGTPINVTVVPEPAGLTLAMLGMVGVVGFGLRRRFAIA